MQEFRKKPVVIEAWQFNGRFDDARDILRLGAPDISFGGDAERGVLQIDTLEGVMTAQPGDWIIRGVKGELYPCKPDIFAATYEPVANAGEATTRAMLLADAQARQRGENLDGRARRETLSLPANLHPSTAQLVERFAIALARKLRTAELQYGFSDGWSRDDWEAECRKRLYEHLEKGDPRDVAAYCAFMWHHGWITARGWT